MKKRNCCILVVALFVVVVALVALLSVCYHSYVKKSYREVCFGETCVLAEIADTPEKRARGLMHRSEVEEFQGMLFIFPTSEKYPFWMKNTLIPLDVIWVNNELTIIDIKTLNPCEADPCPSTSPVGNAKYVIELCGGFAQEHGININDQITFPQ